MSEKIELEFLIDHQKRNVKKIESIKQGDYGKGIEGWYIINEKLVGIIPDEIREQAIRLRKKEEELLLECQISAFNSYERVRELNEEYGKDFVQYDPSMGFVDNCRRGFKPFPDSLDSPTRYLRLESEGEITKEAIKQFESTYLIPILTKLNVLYDQAIEFHKESESPE